MSFGSAPFTPHSDRRERPHPLLFTFSQRPEGALTFSPPHSDRRERSLPHLLTPPHYNNGMDTEKDETTPVEADEETSPAPAKPTPSLSPELLAAGRADKAAWKSGKGPGRWATIGCGLGIVVLIAALFTGSTLMRKTVWAGFAGTSQRVMAYVAGDVQPAERMRLKRNLDAFSAHLRNQDDPFPVMGEFQRLARAGPRRSAGQPRRGRGTQCLFGGAAGRERAGRAVFDAVRG